MAADVAQALRQGNAKLAKGKWEEAEGSFAHGLRLSEDHRDRQAQCMHGLGQVYLQRAVKSSRSGMDFVKAAGLFNSAHSRSVGPRQAELESEIADVVIEFVKCSGGKRVPSRDEIKNELSRHKDLLKAFRERVSGAIESIDSGLNPDHVSTDVKESTYMQRAEKTQQLLLEIKDEIQNMLSSMINECKEVYGEPPCKYAFVGLGSLARVEATPYSDIESAILLEKEDADTKSYFRNLSYLLYIKVVNLGETILPALAIKSLNNFLPEDNEGDWFYDKASPRGMSFDGAMPWASKTPLGREATGTKPALELMATPESMAKFQDEDISVKMGYNLADIMLRVTLIDGDSSLVDEYEALVHAVMFKPDSPSESHTTSMLGLIRGFKLLCNDALHYSLENMEVLGQRSSLGGILDAKKHLYRLPSLLISDLAVIYGIQEASAWKVVTEMRNRDLLSSEGEKNLKICLSLASEARLKTYMTNCGQKESISPLPRFNAALSFSLQDENQIVFHFLDKQKLVRLLSTASQLSDSIFRLCDRWFKKDLTVANLRVFFRTNSMNTCKTYNEGLLWLRLQDFHKALECLHLEPMDSPRKPLCLTNEGYVWGLLSNYQNAIECYQQALHLDKDGKSLNFYRPSCLNNLALMLRSKGQYKKAKETLDEAISLHAARNVEDWLLNCANYYVNMAHIYSDMGEVNAAIELCEKSIEIVENARMKQPPFLDMASMYSTLSCLFQEQNKTEQAKKMSNKALHIANTLLGTDTEHLNFIHIYNNLGLVHELQSNYLQAKNYYEHNKAMLDSLYGNVPHPQRISILNNLGNVWPKLGDLKKGHQCLERAVQECKAVFGNRPVYPLPNIYNDIGAAWKSADEPVKALECLNKAMSMMNDLFEEGYPHPLTCDILNNLGAVYQDLRDFNLAMEKYLKAVRMNEAIYGPDGLHPSVSTAYGNLGDLFQETGDMGKAKENYELAVKVDQNIWQTKHSRPREFCSSLYELATILKDLGMNAEAYSRIQQARDVVRESGCKTTVVAALLYSMFEDLTDMGYDREAAEADSECLQMMTWLKAHGKINLNVD